MLRLFKNQRFVEAFLFCNNLNTIFCTFGSVLLTSCLESSLVVSRTFTAVRNQEFYLFETSLRANYSQGNKPLAATLLCVNQTRPTELLDTLMLQTPYGFLKMRHCSNSPASVLFVTEKMETLMLFSFMVDKLILRFYFYSLFFMLLSSCPLQNPPFPISVIFFSFSVLSISVTPFLLKSDSYISALRDFWLWGWGVFLKLVVVLDLCMFGAWNMKKGCFGGRDLLRRFSLCFHVEFSLLIMLSLKKLLWFAMKWQKNALLNLALYLVTAVV